jgi:hypothetical protein
MLAEHCSGMEEDFLKLIIISLTPIYPFQGVPVHLSSLMSTGKTVSLSGPDENLQYVHSSPSSVASFRIYIKRYLAAGGLF